MVQLVNIKPGEHVLDLACGTGLVSYLAGVAVGTSGTVTGVDISSGMLAQAKAKKSTHSAPNVEFHHHSITNLNSLSAVQSKQFDVVVCASALVLLEYPAAALKQWATYLKKGGRLIVDVTHPESQSANITFERTGRRLGKPVPSYRVPFQKADDLRDMMEDAGHRNVGVKLISQLRVRDATDDVDAYICDHRKPQLENIFDVTDAESMFEKGMGHHFTESVATSDVRQQAKAIFIEEWTKLADSYGYVNEVDGVFVGLGTKL